MNITTTPPPQISLFLLYGHGQLFSKLQAILIQVHTDWPQNNLEHWKVKSTPYTYNYQESQISICVALVPAVLELQAILRQVHQMTQNVLEH